MTTPPHPDVPTVTSKEAHRNWKLVTDKALREPVVITAHGRPRHVLMAYDDYETLRRGTAPAFSGLERSDCGEGESIGFCRLGLPRFRGLFSERMT